MATARGSDPGPTLSQCVGLSRSVSASVRHGMSGTCPAPGRVPGCSLGELSGTVGSPKCVSLATEFLRPGQVVSVVSVSVVTFNASIDWPTVFAEIKFSLCAYRPPWPEANANAAINKEHCVETRFIWISSPMQTTAASNKFPTRVPASRDRAPSGESAITRQRGRQ
jgi:hypothetical protein